MWHSSWTTTRSTAASGAFARKQEKHRLFFPLQLPYRVRSDVILTPVGERPIFSLQKATLGSRRARAFAFRASSWAFEGAGGAEARRCRCCSRWPAIQAACFSTKLSMCFFASRRGARTTTRQSLVISRARVFRPERISSYVSMGTAYHTSGDKARGRPPLRKAVSPALPGRLY